MKKEETQVVGQATLSPEELDAQAKKLAEQKARKLANDKRLKELHKQEAADRVKKAGALVAYMKQNKLFEKLSPDFQDFLNKLANPPVSRSTVSVFDILFGENAKVGTTVTLMEAFQKTMKGKAQIDHFIEKKWKPAGIIVEFENDANNLLNSKYILKKLADKAVVEE